MEEYKLAKEIDDCSVCPLQGDECNGITSNPNGYSEPPCASWDENDEIYAGMMEDKWLAYEESMELQKKQERQFKAKKAAETRKKYAHLNEKIDLFKDFLKKNNKWTFIFTARRKNKIFLRIPGNRKATYFFDIETDSLYTNNSYSKNFFVNLHKKTTYEEFEHDWIEYFTGSRPKDHDYVSETINEVFTHVDNFFNKK